MATTHHLLNGCKQLQLLSVIFLIPRIIVLLLDLVLRDWLWSKPEVILGLHR
jgi:hypothetical protein